MTSQPMTCTEFQDALGAYLEGDLDPATEAAAERHRASCAHCAALASDLERIAADAAALPTLSAGRDLWAGIAERISTPVVELTGRGGVPTGLLRVAPRRWRNWPLAAAAAALVAVTAGLTYQVTARSLRGGAADAPTVAANPSVPRGGPDAAGRTTTIAALPADSAGRAGRESPSPAPTTGGSPSAGPSAGPALVARREGADPARTGAALVARRSPRGGRAPLLLPEEAVYDEEIAVLRAALGQRRAELDSGTVAILERNIGVIDAAIRQSREALARDPRSPFLGEQLSRALDRKVHLLRTAAALPART